LPDGGQKGRRELKRGGEGLRFFMEVGGEKGLGRAVAGKIPERAKKHEVGKGKKNVGKRTNKREKHCCAKGKKAKKNGMRLKMASNGTGGRGEGLM